MADKEGTYTIPGATIVADGQNKTSNSVQIKVLPPDQTNGVGGGNNSGGRTSSRSQVAGSKITNQDLFITATASKTTVYEQEAILLTYKVYTLVNLRQLRGDMPKLTNIYVQEVELPQQRHSLWNIITEETITLLCGVSMYFSPSNRENRNSGYYL